MQTIIPGRFHSIIQAAVASGRYASVEDAVLSAIGQWAQAEAALQAGEPAAEKAGADNALLGPDFDAWLDRAYGARR
jgi:Arc/MetJ-type ribon-helix-helix transcriptional regulator